MVAIPIGESTEQNEMKSKYPRFDSPSGQSIKLYVFIDISDG